MAAIDTGDTAFLLVCAALVMFMTPGLALFYGGMVRGKNVLGTVMQSFFLLGVVSVLWALIGYTLAFGPDVGHVIGDLSHLGLRGVGQLPDPAYAATVPALVFMVFQLMFAVITPALITGALGRTHEVLELLDLHCCVVPARLQPHGSLGLGSRWLDSEPRCPGLRRGHRGAHQLRRRRLGGRVGRR